MIYEPAIEGRLGNLPQGHPHLMRIASWTLEGPLKALMSCRDCTRTVTVKASRKISKIPAGFTSSSWEKFLQKGEARLAGGG